MKKILNLLQTNLLKEGVGLQNLKFKIYANQILAKVNGLELRITKKGEAFSVAIADEEGEFGSIADSFNAIENAVEYSVIEIREMLNFPNSMKEMLFDCCHC
jgi:hypothetical protein